MIKATCIRDFRSYSGKLIFIAGEKYPIDKNNVISCGNYALQYTKHFSKYFKIQHVKPTDL